MAIVPGMNMAGILFAEDFDALPDEPPPLEETTAEIDLTPPPPTFTEEEVSEAVKKAVSKAVADATERTRTQVEQEKKEQAEQEKADLQRIINEALSDIRTQMGERLKNYAETLASTLISTAVSAFPQWPEHDDTFCSATLLQEILPLFTGDFRVVLRLHPHNVEILEKELSSQSSVDRSWLIIEPDTAVQKSDFEMKWPDGELKRNLGDLSETILMALSTNTTTSLSTGSAS